MRVLCCQMGLVLLLQGPGSWAVAPVPAEAPAGNRGSIAGREVPRFEAHLEDDSVVRFDVLTPVVSIRMLYGSGSSRGRHSRNRFPVAARARGGCKVKAASARLQDEQFDRARPAKKELLELGLASYLSVGELSHSGNWKTASASAILKELEGQYSQEQLGRSPRDIIRTPTFEIVGEIVVPALRSGRITLATRN